MKINIKELLDLFDDKKESEKGDANAIMSILGEDLNAAAYRHFRKDEVDILKENVVQGFQGGKHLDRWILDKKENRLFQCEIKNWAATAIGGKSLKSQMQIKSTLRRLPKVIGSTSCLLIYQENQQKNTNTRTVSVRYYSRCVTQVGIRVLQWSHYSFIGCRFRPIKPG